MFTDFDRRNDQQLKISHISPPDYWQECLTVGNRRHSWRLSPLSHA